MSIRLWDRDPDASLYDGDYSPCCISIESGCGRDRFESTISDYLTDCAIQVVNIVDKDKNIPITSAWCWLGKDQAGSKAFVIDNVESNTDYTNKYPSLLSTKLYDYILKYAESIGFKEQEIFIGKEYNDLDLKFQAVNRNLVKMGKSNRRGGYYLEAEEIDEV